MATIGTIDHSHAGAPALHALAKNWWLVLLRGLCAIGFGVLAFAWPGVTLGVLVLFYGIFALADGALALAAAVTGETAGSRWWLALAGLVGIGVGFLTFGWPGITALALLLLIAVWAIAVGVMQIVGAIRMGKESGHEWLLMASGAVSVLFGVLLLAQPKTGALALLLVIAVYAVIYGVTLVAFAFRLKQHA